jgi:hypothetical protein
MTGAYCASSVCGTEATHKENELWLCEKHYKERINQPHHAKVP